MEAQKNLESSPRIELIAYGAEEFIHRELKKLDEIDEYIGKFPVLWLNIERRGNTKIVEEVGAKFNLHPLSLEDVVHTHQRPKVEPYADHHFIIVQMAHLREHLETEQLSMFFSHSFVITFQELPGDCLDSVRARVKEKTDKCRKMSADYLAYAILDAVVDGYFPVLEKYGDKFEELEDELVLNPNKDSISALRELKRDLLVIRRATWPLRDAVNILSRDPLGIVSPETSFYLRDCYDHLIQLIDLEENYRELASDLMDIYLSSISYRTNEIMKVLTIIATIFIPLTFIVGLYGMNFNTEISPLNMPELNWKWGYPFSLALMLAVAGVMVIFFKRKGWM